MLKLYGADLSSPSNKVRFTANILGLKYQYVKIRINKGDNKKESYLKLHPAGKIPSIDDDGFVLFESNAIIKYLARKEKSDIYPDELHKRAHIDQWMDFIAIHIDTAVGKVLFNKIFVKFINILPDEKSVNDGLMFLSRYLPIIEQIFNTNKFFMGEKLSLVDITLLAALDSAEIGGIDLSVYTNLARWRENLQAQSFYTQSHRQYGENIEKILARKV